MANFVPGEGDLSSKIWIVGEAPGANEDRTGRPFVGGAGSVLDGLLQEAKISRRLCYIDNVVQYQPEGNNFGVYYRDSKREQPTADLEKAHERIRMLVAKHRPNIVIALGNEALYALTGLKQITKWRGSILSCNDVKVIPTIHPAMVMRQYEFRVRVLFDLCKAQREALTPSFPELTKDDFKINPSFEEILHYIELLHKAEYISFDIETSITQKQILCIGLAWSKSQAICIPIYSNNTSIFTIEQELAILKALRELFASTSIKFIAQNAQFDMTFLKDKWNIEVPNLWMDTMIAHHCIYPELPKGLDFLVSIYTNHPYHKDMIHGGIYDFWVYNCMDAARTYECAFEIEKEAKDFGTYSFYRKCSHELIKPLFDMQQFGCRFDVAKRNELDKTLTKDKEDLQRRLEVAVGHPINVNSPAQMKDLLYTEFKYPPVYRKRKVQGEIKTTITADDEALAELDKKHPGNPMFKLVQEIRGIGKLLSTYVQVNLDKDERIRCSYVISGTDTGRLSSRASIYDTGTNLQNIPRGPLIRSLFIPDTGFKFVELDLSQAEARVVAFISRDERLQSIFEEGGDVHRKNASIIFKRPPAAITDKERDLGKMLVHASNYMVGAGTFATNIGATKPRAQELLNAYYANYPRIKRWHDEVKESLFKTRILETPLGRKRMFFGRLNDETLRSAVAYVPQSTVGDLLNLGLIKAYSNCPIGWRPIIQVHDSVLWQVPIDTPIEHCWKFLKHYFEIPINIHGKTMKIPCDIKVGDTWGSMKKVKLA